VAIENNGYPYTTAKMSTMGWLGGINYMTKAHRIKDEYFEKNELAPEELDNYDKILIINALVSVDEARAAGVKKISKGALAPFCLWEACMDSNA